VRKLLNTYLSISKREFNGLLALVIVIIAIAAVPTIYEHIVGKLSTEDSVLPINIPADIARSARVSANKKYRQHRSEELFEFDPNTISQSDWQRLGLSERQSAAIINYRTKGGKFRKPEDLQKMYTISQRVYQRILPYVKISPETTKHSSEVLQTLSQRPAYVKKSLNIIEINGADSVALLEIRGIGPAFASRIIKYRQRIGGFCQKEQLMEVYGLDSFKFTEIKEQVSLDLAAIRKIDINNAQLEDFKGHPYIRYKQANAIIQYRKQHGAYAGIADLSKVLILDPETITRIAPYLTF
jgi:competence protein ComEA